MLTTLRPYLTAGLALTTAGVVAVTPIAPRAADAAAVSIATGLTAGESLLNVPLNLFQALFNIPFNQTYALDTIGQSLLYTGPLFVGSPSNIWGEEPGDPGHFEALANFYLPFPVISGAGHEGDWDFPGIGQQLAMLAAVEIPSDLTCASLLCMPAMPTSPITGITSIDTALWWMLIGTGLQKFPLIDNWFQVPFSEMTNGNAYFFDPTSPGMVNSGWANDGFLWQGNVTPAEVMAEHPEMETEHPDAWAGLQAMDPDTPLMPWAGDSFELNLAQPFVNFWDSLQQPFDANNFLLPDPVDFLRALQTIVAGSLIVFNPFVPGSPYCPGPCLLPGENPGPNGTMTDTEGIPTFYAAIKAIGDLWPGNTSINEWLDSYHDGTANVSTAEYMDLLAELWRWGGVLFDFDNPLPTDPRMFPLAIDTSGYLPSLEDINNAIGPYLFNIGYTSGIFGPFDADALWNALFDFNATPIDFPAGPDIGTDTVPDTVPDTDAGIGAASDLAALMASAGADLF